MQAAALIILSLTLIGTIVAGPVASLAQGNAGIREINMLAEASALGNSADPDLTVECFNYYLPVLNKISTNFSLAYEKCITNVNTATDSLNQAAAFNQTLISNEAAVICNAFKVCNGDSDALDFFNCYASAASDDVTNAYSLSTNALNAAITLKTGLQEIKSLGDLCINNAQSNYVMQTAEAYDELNACFLNGLPDTSTVAQVSSASTVSSASPASSAAPESTAAPTSSPVPASSATTESTDTTLPGSSFTSATSAASSLLS